MALARTRKFVPILLVWFLLGCHTLFQPTPIYIPVNIVHFHLHRLYIFNLYIMASRGQKKLTIPTAKELAQIVDDYSDWMFQTYMQGDDITTIKASLEPVIPKYGDRYSAEELRDRGATYFEIFGESVTTKFSDLCQFIQSNKLMHRYSCVPSGHFPGLSRKDQRYLQNSYNNIHFFLRYLVEVGLDLHYCCVLVMPGRMKPRSSCLQLLYLGPLND